MFTFEGVIIAFSIVGMIFAVLLAMPLWVKFCVDRELPFILYMSPYLLISMVVLSLVASQVTL